MNDLRERGNIEDDKLDVAWGVSGQKDFIKHL